MSEPNGLSQRETEDASWMALTAGYAGGINALSARMAEQLSPVFACVDVISSALASLPARIYRRTGGQRSVVEDHPALRIIEEPNRWQTWADFVQWHIAQALLHGNAAAWIEIDRDTTRLVPVTEPSLYT